MEFVIGAALGAVVGSVAGWFAGGYYKARRLEGAARAEIIEFTKARLRAEAQARLDAARARAAEKIAPGSDGRGV